MADAGLAVSALSLINNLTDPHTLGEEIDAATTFIRLAPLFKTTLVKLTPGPPASAHATEDHWRCLANGVSSLVEVARDAGVRLAFETHMRQLTDTVAGSLRLLEMTPQDVVGLTVDFSNLVFLDEDLAEAIPVLAARTFHAHVKNGTIGGGGEWCFGALDTGWTDYTQVLPMLQAAGYDGYLSVECLGPDTQSDPAGTAARDLAILRGYLNELEPQQPKG